MKARFTIPWSVLVGAAGVLGVAVAGFVFWAESSPVLPFIYTVGGASSTSAPSARPPRAARRAETRRSAVESAGYTKRAASREPAPPDRDASPHATAGVVRAAEDPLSTFAVDVDTASWTLARSALESGRAVRPETVRVEEFVNAFDYDYVGPIDEAGGDPAPFAVNMEAAPHPCAPGWHALRVGVQGREVPLGDRPPIHLTLLVDTSGSMGTKDGLALAQRAMRYLVAQLAPADTVALATYAGSVSRVLEPTPAAARGEILAAIDGLSAGGGTAMGSGIGQAYAMADAAYVPGHENRVLVFSDGDANLGATSHEAILADIADYAGRGITLSTLGFGTGSYQDAMMEQLADRGDGNYHYIDDMRAVEKVFGRDLLGTLQVIARDVKIQIAFDPGVVTRYRLLGYENRAVADEDFREDAVDAGEIGAGHQVTAVYEVQLAPDFSRAGADLAAVALRSKPPGVDAPAVEWETSVPARLVRADLQSASPSFRRAWVAAGLAELLGRSPHATCDPDALMALLDRSSVQDRELMAALALASERLRPGAEPL